MAEASSKVSFFSFSRLKKRIPYFLFFTGLIIGLGVFIGDHADEMPWVLRYIAPASYHEEAGIDALKKGKILNSGDEGFLQISSTLIANVKMKSEDSVISEDSAPSESDVEIGIRDIKISGLGGFTSGMEPLVSFTAFSPNHPEIWPTPLEGSLQPAILDADRRKSASILPFCFGLFLLSSILEIIGFLMESREE